MKILSVFSACLLLGFHPMVSAQENTAWINTFKSINREVLQHGEAYTRLGESVDKIGHRLTGSANGIRAEQYAFDLLRSYGFEEVRFQPFSLDGWIRENLELHVGNDGDMKPVKAVSLALTPAEANVTGELLDVGNGLESDYTANPDAVKGKIVLAALNLLPDSPTGTSNVHRSVKAALAMKYGAKGIILFNRVEGGVLLTGTASSNGQPIDFPAICISLEDGNILKEQLAKAPKLAHIRMKNKTGRMTARNVIARIAGSEFPDEKIVVGGHLDSWDLSPGAVDNGLGAFSVIDMARTFKELGLKPKRTVEFVLFMGEEQGLLGSGAYVKQAVEDGSIDQIRFMLNFDMTNDPKSFYSSLEASRELITLIGDHVTAVDTSFRNNFSARVGLYSDHQPFMIQGVPIGGASDGTLTRKALDCYHADCDDFDLVDEQGMKNTVRFSTMLIYGLADVPHFNIKRLNDEETKQLMLDNNLEEPLRIGGYWRWD